MRVCGGGGRGMGVHVLCIWIFVMSSLLSLLSLLLKFSTHRTLKTPNTISGINVIYDTHVYIHSGESK